MAAPLWFYEAVATGRHGAMIAERSDTEISNGSQGGQEQNALDWVGSCGSDWDGLCCLDVDWIGSRWVGMGWVCSGWERLVWLALRLN